MNICIVASKQIFYYTTAKICGRIMLWRCRRRRQRLVCGHIGFRNLSFDGVNPDSFDILIH